MKLYAPSKAEAEFLLGAPIEFLGWSVVKDALPPAFLIHHALAMKGSNWCMPRLFCDEQLGRIVGSAAFKSEPNDRKAELGYGVSPDYRNRGYATRGVRLMVEEAFASGLIDEVLAETLPANLASRRVLEKAGFFINGLQMREGGPVELWTNRKSAPDLTS